MLSVVPERDEVFENLCLPAVVACACRREADAEMAHPDRAYGQPMLRSKLQLAPLPSGVRREEACGPEDAAKSFFLTQAPGAQAGLDGYSSADERRCDSHCLIPLRLLSA